MEKCSEAVPGYKYFEVHCYGDNDDECYLITTNESVARGFAMSQMSAIDAGSPNFRFNSIHIDEIESCERLVL